MIGNANKIQPIQLDATALPTAILLVSNNLLFVCAIRAFIARLRGNCEILLSGAVADAMHTAKTKRIEFAFLDPSMPDLDGLDYIPDFISHRLACFVVIITDRTDFRTLKVLSEVPYHGWIDPRSTDLSQLAVAMDTIQRGSRYVSDTILHAIARLHRVSANFKRALTQREELLLSLLAEGLDDNDAAQRVGICTETIRSHREHIMKKLDLHHKGELMQYAHEKGYLRVTGNSVLHPGFDREFQSASYAERRAIDLSKLKAVDV